MNADGAWGRRNAGGAWGRMTPAARVGWMNADGAWGRRNAGGAWGRMTPAARVGWMNAGGAWGRMTPAARVGPEEGEQAGRVVLVLDGRELVVVAAVVGLAPVGQVGVDVVLVGLAAGVAAHRAPVVAQPGVLVVDPGAARADGPAGGVLGGEQGVPVHERGRVRLDPVDGAAEGVERDPADAARGTGYPLQRGDAGQQGADPRAAQRGGEEVRLGELGRAAQLAAARVPGQVAGLVADRAVARLGEHRGQEGLRLAEVPRRRACAGLRPELVDQGRGVVHAAQVGAADRDGGGGPAGGRRQVQVRPERV